MKKLLFLVVLAAFSMAATAKDGRLDMDFGYVRMRGRTHSDGLVILRDMRKPVICRMRKISDDERETAFVKWGEAVRDAFDPRKNK